MAKSWNVPKGNQNPYIEEEKTIQWPKVWMYQRVIRIRISKKKKRQYIMHCLLCILTSVTICTYSIYLCKTQIRVRPQIRALSSNMCLPTNPWPIKLLYPQIRVLLPRRYMSFGIASHSNLCPPKSIFPQICALHFGRKMTS
jgi:hypothetical protein